MCMWMAAAEKVKGDHCFLSGLEGDCLPVHGKERRQQGYFVTKYHELIAASNHGDSMRWYALTYSPEPATSSQ